jgi:hypothetical protein
VTLIGRAALPGRAPQRVIDRLTKLYRHGLIAQHPVGLREHTRSDGKPPLLYSLTRRGLQVAQTRQPPAISQRREWRPIEPGRALRLAHDLHALAWAIELHQLLGDTATDHWRTPRYATGRYPVPQAGTGRDRHPITTNEIPIPDKQAIIDLGLKVFTEVKPDLSLELRIDTPKLTFDLLVELDLTADPPITATSSSPTTRSCAAGASPTPATTPKAPAPPSCSSAPTPAPRWPARAKPTS